MGWLRELMRGASPPIEGYGELARRALVHPEWPPDTQPHARSLAALFSKLDRGIELEWLADRDAVQRTLALVLACPIEAVRRAVAPDPESVGLGRVRLDDLPYARPLALREEALPPGLPPRVLLPSTWRRLWWVAPSGSGRSLAGQWLAARGLARFLSAVCWLEVADRLHAAGPLFLELERGDDLDQLCAALPDGPVCVAAPVPPAASDGPSRWEVVSAPASSEVLPALLAWVAARVPDDGAFEPVAAEAWLRGPIASGQLPTLGAVLGAAGLLDARGVREARGKSLCELAEPFVNERLERASFRGGAEAQWLKRFGFGALVQLAQSALTSGQEPWAVARSQDEWIALVPAELAKSVDSEWVRWSLARSGGQTPLRAIERALDEAPPGAYRIVRALVEAGLLSERAPGRLALVPEFLKHAALTRAREALVNEASPFGWGEALLRPHAAPAVLDALYQRLGTDSGPVEQLAELDVPSHPALVVANEATLVCLGLHALSGSDVPLEPLAALWNEQLASLVELPGELPRPRLLCTTGYDVSPLARHPVWMLAMLAVSELLAEREGRAHPLLRPWGVAHAARTHAVRPLLDAIYAELARPELASQEWAVEAFALAGRLLEVADDDADELELADDAEASRDIPHPLSRPTRLCRTLLHAELDGGMLAGFGEHPLELRALAAACALSRIAWPRMAHALWKCWQSGACPADGDRLFSPESAHAQALWPHLPPEVLGAAWERWSGASSWPFASFGPLQWAAFVDYFAERWRRAPGSPVWMMAFEHLQLDGLERAVDGGGLCDARDPAARCLLACAWRRFPAWSTSRLAARATSGEATAVGALLDAVPAALEADVVRVLAEELSRRSTRREVIDTARAWLHDKVAARRGDWREAYALLVELENRLARAHLARGATLEPPEPGGGARTHSTERARAAGSEMIQPARAR